MACRDRAQRYWTVCEIYVVWFLEKINGHKDSADDDAKADACRGDKTEAVDAALEVVEAPVDVVKSDLLSVEADLPSVEADLPSVEFAIIHNKDKYTVSMSHSSTIGQLKDKLVDIIGVPSKMQKIMIKGLAKDDQTLESLNVSSSSKIMVVGAKLQDIVAVSLPKAEEVRETIVLWLKSFEEIFKSNIFLGIKFK